MVFTNGSFNHPLIPDKKIDVFTDVPHLFKTNLKQLFESGFLLKNTNDMN